MAWLKSVGWLKVLAWFSAGAAALLLGVYVLVSWQIGVGVRKAVTHAVGLHPGDRVEALMQVVEDSSEPMRQRNLAVWALGQLGDTRALETLRPHYHGGECDHVRALCQGELEKAIHLLEGGFNATAWIWRRPEASGT